MLVRMNLENTQLPDGQICVLEEAQETMLALEPGNRKSAVSVPTCGASKLQIVFNFMMARMYYRCVHTF